jgi:DNA-binding NtrC family response regulator
MKTILVVDDSDEQRFLLAKNAAYVAQEVLEAAGVRPAVEILEREDVDLVVVDLKLGNDVTAGLALLKHAKLKDDAIQVIIVTNFATPGISRQAMEGGAFDFMDRNPSGVDFYPLLRGKMELAVHYRKLLLRDRARQPVEHAN